MSQLLILIKTLLPHDTAKEKRVTFSTSAFYIVMLPIPFLWLQVSFNDSSDIKQWPKADNQIFSSNVILNWSLQCVFFLLIISISIYSITSCLSDKQKIRIVYRHKFFIQ